MQRSSLLNISHGSIRIRNSLSLLPDGILSLRPDESNPVLLFSLAAPSIPQYMRLWLWLCWLCSLGRWRPLVPQQASLPAFHISIIVKLGNDRSWPLPVGWSSSSKHCNRSVLTSQSICSTSLMTIATTVGELDSRSPLMLAILHHLILPSMSSRWSLRLTFEFAGWSPWSEAWSPHQTTMIAYLSRLAFRL